MPTRQEITGVILAGGRGRRMGGLDKGLIELAGRPLVEQVVNALAPQVQTILINANRNAEIYARYGYPVVADDLHDYQGPLAGLVAAMAVATTPWFLSVPCDAPYPHPELASRLTAVLQQNRAELAIAHDGSRLQPIYALIPVTFASDIRIYLNSGERRIGYWYTTHRMAIADFSDSPAYFRNINSPEEWENLRHS
jgi:molybdenum cofactor guanylyltransferase